MFIEAIKIEAITYNDKTFGRFVSFLNEGEKKEINLIYGKNTLGKSTLIMSIVYALAGEDIYGKSTWNDTNFKPIMKSYEGQQYKENSIFLQLINKVGERIVIQRNALDRDDSVIVYRDVDISQLQICKKVEYYKIKKEKGIQGNKTYQVFLFSFFNIPTYIKDDDAQVYFQNLIPLFIIHQTAWNDIQASNPYYGIPETKKIAFQMIMNLSLLKTQRILIMKFKTY